MPRSRTGWRAASRSTRSAAPSSPTPTRAAASTTSPSSSPASRTTRTFDKPSVGVVGAGPAGAAAALALARAGVGVTLYRPARPGEKPCGGAVPSAFLPSLEGFDATPLPAVSPRRLVLENAAGSVVRVDAAGLHIFRRADFDAALAQAAVAAGARLVAERVEEVRLGGDDVEVRAGSERHRHDFVVGADGARGLCRRSLGLRGRALKDGESGGESIGLGASLEGPEPDALALAFPDAADAYCWVFPRPGGASVGIAYDPERLSDGAAHAALGRFLDRHLEGGARVLDRAHRYRYPIPLYGASTLDAARRGQNARVLLVGDAVGVADPLTREGIRWSLLSGLWAAECLIAGTPDRYADRLEEGLAPELGRAARAARLFYDDPLGQWMVPVARSHAGIRSVLGDLLTCRHGYRGLRRTLLKALAGRYAHTASIPTSPP